MTMTTISGLCALMILSSVAHANPVKTRGGATCDRTLSLASLTAAEMAQLNKEGQADRFEKQSNGYLRGYIFARAPFDAELVMGVYSSCGEHAGKNGLGSFINRSEIVNNTEGKNPFQVFYEQSGSWGFSGGEYTMENTIKAENGGFLMTSKLIDSTDAHFSPVWADGYMRVVPDGNGVAVVACNYMVPRDGDFARGTYNGMSHDRLIASGKNLLKWITRVSKNATKSDSYRQKLRALLGK